MTAIVDDSSPEQVIEAVKHLSEGMCLILGRVLCRLPSDRAAAVRTAIASQAAGLRFTVDFEADRQLRVHCWLIEGDRLRLLFKGDGLTHALSGPELFLVKNEREKGGT